jgi:hypothetical protein
LQKQIRDHDQQNADESRQVEQVEIQTHRHHLFAVGVACDQPLILRFPDQPVGMAESDDIRSAIATLKSCETAAAVK